MVCHDPDGVSPKVSELKAFGDDGANVYFHVFSPSLHVKERPNGDESPKSQAVARWGENPSRKSLVKTHGVERLVKFSTTAQPTIKDL
jgi:hypothetical protein